MDQALLKPSSSYEQMQCYKILLHQLAAIGGKKFVDAAKEFFSGGVCENSRQDDAKGDRIYPLADTRNQGHHESSINSNTAIHTLYSNHAGANLATPSIKEISEISYGQKAKRQKIWKPHYETATKITEIRRNENLNMRTNMQVESRVPFIVGTSLSRSHNILLNCQHVFAQLKINQTAQPNKRGDEKVSQQVTQQNLSEIALRTPENQMNDGITQNFKGVLQHLYDDYSNLSREYDELVKVMSLQGINKKYVKQEAKNLEQALDRKEQEILMLVILYREVINLKDRAQEKASKNSMKLLKSKQNAVSLSSSTDYKLKFLLNQIQKFEKLLINRN